VANVRKVTPEKKAEFIEALRETGNVTKASESLLVAPKTFYAYRKSDPDFAAAWDSAYADGQQRLADDLEHEAITRATSGKSDTLLIFLLKGLKPDKYRERYEQRLTGHEGGPIEFVNITSIAPTMTPPIPDD
jgi:hypothetical protein